MTERGFPTTAKIEDLEKQIAGLEARLRDSQAAELAEAKLSMQQARELGELKARQREKEFRARACTCHNTGSTGCPIHEDD